MSTTSRLLLGLGIGVFLGLVLARVAPDAALAVSEVVAPVGRLWLNALQMTVVPLIVALLVVGVATGGGAALSGRVARRSIMLFVIILAAVAAFSACVAPLAMAVLPFDQQLIERLSDLAGSAVPAGAVSTSDWFGSLIPSNAVAAAAGGAILQLVVFSLLFAFALTQVAQERRVRAVEFFHAIADAMIVMVRWVLWLAPLGVFALVFPLCATTGVGLIGALGYFVLLQCSLCIAITIAMYGVAVLGGRQGLRRFALAVLPAQAVAASTQSSLASLPAMVQSATSQLGQPAAVTGLVLPLAVSLFRATSPASFMACAAFTAWAYGLELSVSQLALGAIVAVVMALGGVGLPGGASFMATHSPVLQAMGLPIDLLGLLLAVDVIPDVFATVGNVTADVAATSVVARTVHADVPAANPAPGR